MSNRVKTPLTNEGGSARGADDFQLRANIKKMFNQLKDNEHSIKVFSKKFIVDEKLAKEYVNHLREIEVRKEKRMKTNKEKSAKERFKIYVDYDWTTLCKDGTLKKLKVVEHEKYLTYQLPKNKKQKSDKVDITQTHVGRKIFD